MPHTPTHGNLADALGDQLITHDIDLVRLEVGRARTVRGMLQRLGKQIRDEIRDSDPRKRRRLNDLLRTVNQHIKNTYQEIIRRTEAETAQLITIEATAAMNTVNAAVGVELLNTPLSATQVQALASSQIVLGAPTAVHWARQSQKTQNSFSDAMRLGAGLGESIDKLVKRISPIIAQSDVDARALVRTSINSISNSAREAIYLKHPEVIKGVYAVATLDKDTSQICMSRDHHSWTLPDGKPIPPTTEAYPSYPPWHWNCRSTLAPIVRSFRELAGPNANQRVLDMLDDIPESTRESMDGQVPKLMDFESWLKTKPEAFQREKLGPFKFKRWKEGKLPFSAMVDQSGNPITIADLAEAV